MVAMASLLATLLGHFFVRLTLCKTQPKDGPPQMTLPKALHITSPFAYIQSAFETGHRDLKQGAKFLSREERLAQLRIYASNVTSFRGGEMFMNTLETEASMLDIREMNSLILQVARETGTPPFVGMWIPARLPGFFWPGNYSKQPSMWRARGLMSNGSFWTFFPPDTKTGTSILNFNGHFLDVTNPEAVSAMLANLRRVFRAHCESPGACVGPLVGTLLFSEAGLASTYRAHNLPPYAKVVDAEYGNISDLQPQRADGKPPKLGLGDPEVLYSDSNVSFSFYQGPKRTIPLFTISAKDSFVCFASQRGVNVSHLPADRLEFNDDSTVSLPSHVRFVPLSDKAVWKTWEDWVYATWFSFVNATAMAVLEAQGGNQYFGGAMYFQLAGWYSVRNRSQSPVTYSWRDFSGAIHVSTETLAKWVGYSELNPVSRGIDLELMASAPWFAGFVHESSHGVPHLGCHVPTTISPTDRLGRDRAFLSCPKYQKFINAQGSLAREVCRFHGKAFGVFARAAYINDPTWHGPSVADTLTTEAFAQAWSYETAPLSPDIVSSLSPERFVPAPNSSTAPCLHDIFAELFGELQNRSKAIWWI